MTEVGYVHLSSHDMKALCKTNVLFPLLCTISAVIFREPSVPFSFSVDVKLVDHNICDTCSYPESISGSFLTTAAKKTFWRREILINERACYTSLNPDRSCNNNGNLSTLTASVHSSKINLVYSVAQLLIKSILDSRGDWQWFQV